MPTIVLHLPASWGRRLVNPSSAPWSVIVAFVACVLATPPAGASNIKVVLRYDDYTSFANEARRRPVEMALFSALRQMRGGVLVGVLPFPGRDYPAPTAIERDLALDMSAEKLALLNEYARDKVVTIGLHGFSHQDNKLGARSSEFAGLPQEQQVRLLRAAKRSLEVSVGQDVRIFIPPFNQYDAATLRALDATGFDLLSAGASGPVIQELPIRYLPGGVYPDALKRTVLAAHSRGHDDVLVVATMHPYDIAETGESMPAFRAGGQVSIEALLRDLGELAVEGRATLASVQKLVETGEDLSPARFSSNDRLRSSLVSSHRLLPEIFNLYPLQGVYYQRAAAERMRALQIVVAVAFYAACFLISAIAAMIMLRRVVVWRRSAPIAVAGLASAGLLAVGMKAHFGGLYLSSLLGFAVCLGMLASVAAHASRSGVR